MGKIENKNAMQRFEQMHGAEITRLFWIAGSLYCDGLKELFEGMVDSDLESLFPDIFKSGIFSDGWDVESICDVMVNYNKFGLLAEISVPQCHTFEFKPGKSKPVSWKVNNQVTRFVYCYSESQDDLLNKIEKLCENIFMEDMVRERGIQGK